MRTRPKGEHRPMSRDRDHGASSSEKKNTARISSPPQPMAQRIQGEDPRNDPRRRAPQHVLQAQRPAPKRIGVPEPWHMHHRKRRERRRQQAASRPPAAPRSRSDRGSSRRRPTASASITALSTRYGWRENQLMTSRLQASTTLTPPVNSCWRTSLRMLSQSRKVVPRKSKTPVGALPFS